MVLAETVLHKTGAHHCQLLIGDTSTELPDHHPSGVHHVGLVGGDVVGVAVQVQVHGHGQAEVWLIHLLMI